MGGCVPRIKDIVKMHKKKSGFEWVDATKKIGGRWM